MHGRAYGGGRAGTHGHPGPARFYGGLGWRRAGFWGLGFGLGYGLWWSWRYPLLYSYASPYYYNWYGLAQYPYWAPAYTVDESVAREYNDNRTPVPESAYKPNTREFGNDLQDLPQQPSFADRGIDTRALRYNSSDTELTREQQRDAKQALDKINDELNAVRNEARRDPRYDEWRQKGYAIVPDLDRQRFDWIKQSKQQPNDMRAVLGASMDQAADEEMSDVLLRRSFVNNAWGYRASGEILMRDGTVWRYDTTDREAKPRDIATKLDVHADEYQLSELQRLIDVVGARGSVTETYSGNDMGKTELVGYTTEGAPVILSGHGDEKMINTEQHEVAAIEAIWLSIHRRPDEAQSSAVEGLSHHLAYVDAGLTEADVLLEHSVRQGHQHSGHILTRDGRIFTYAVKTYDLHRLEHAWPTGARATESQLAELRSLIARVEWSSKRAVVWSGRNQSALVAYDEAGRQVLLESDGRVDTTRRDGDAIAEIKAIWSSLVQKETRSNMSALGCHNTHHHCPQEPSHFQHWRSALPGEILLDEWAYNTKWKGHGYGRFLTTDGRLFSYQFEQGADLTLTQKAKVAVLRDEAAANAAQLERVQTLVGIVSQGHVTRPKDIYLEKGAGRLLVAYLPGGSQPVIVEGWGDWQYTNAASANVPEMPSEASRELASTFHHLIPADARFD
jgi:hypothetical protein